MTPGTVPVGAIPPPVFAQISSVNYKTDVILSRLDNMQPGVITESISFLIGAFCAIAFVIAARRFNS